MAEHEAIPFYEHGDTITGEATENVAGKTFARVSAARPYGPGFSLTSTDSGGGNIQVATAVSGGPKLGVFANDALLGQKVPIICAPGTVMPVIAAVALSAWQEVAVGAGGQATALSAGTGVAATGEIGKANNNARLLATAQAADSEGNAIKIVIPALTASKVFGITVVDQEIIIQPKTSAGSVSETTVAELITKLAEAGNATAAGLIKIANAAGSSGAGVLEPGTLQLSGGLDAGQTRAVGITVSSCNQGEDAQVRLYTA